MYPRPLIIAYHGLALHHCARLAFVGRSELTSQYQLSSARAFLSVRDPQTQTYGVGSISCHKVIGALLVYRLPDRIMA